MGTAPGRGSLVNFSRRPGSPDSRMDSYYADQNTLDDIQRIVPCLTPDSGQNVSSGRYSPDLIAALIKHEQLKPGTSETSMSITSHFAPPALRRAAAIDVPTVEHATDDTSNCPPLFDEFLGRDYIHWQNCLEAQFLDLPTIPTELTSPSAATKLVADEYGPVTQQIGDLFDSFGAPGAETHAFLNPMNDSVTMPIPTHNLSINGMPKPPPAWDLQDFAATTAASDAEG